MARMIGRVSIGIVAVVVVAGTVAFWNPWRLVVVERVLYVPAVAIVTAIVFGCAFAALPVPAGSRRPWTPGQRALALIGVPLLSLQMWSMAVPGWPSDGPRELARSPDGRHVVMLHRTFPDRPCLSVWTGARVAGSLGDPGEEPVVTFTGPDRVEVRTDDPPRRFDLRLDPGGGRPLDTLLRPC